MSKLVFVGQNCLLATSCLNLACAALDYFLIDSQTPIDEAGDFIPTACLDTLTDNYRPKNVYKNSPFG